MSLLAFPALSAPPDNNLLVQRLRYIFQTNHFKHLELPKVNHHENWGFYADSSSRLQQLRFALDSNVKAIWAARGGYGASDLLEEIDFDAHKKPIFIGFSDFSSLMSARYAACSGFSWHASMPGGTFWYDDAQVKEFLEQLKSDSPSGKIVIQENIDKPLQGKLFGGCFSVLTNLIGTPYFPRSLEGHVLILEDIEEHPARLMRYWRQWEYSGALKGVRAVVFGRLVYKDPAYRDFHDIFMQFLKQNSSIPIYTTHEVGHIHNNKPFLIGSDAVLEDNELKFSATLS